MEEKESTVSASPENSDTDDSPPPVTSTMAAVPAGPPPPPPLMSMNVNMGKEERRNMGNVAMATPPTMGSNSDLFGKKKRGRPRKYDSEGNLRVKPLNRKTPPPPGFSFSPSDHSFSSSASSSKRGRGRPPGSGNWKLLASLGEFIRTRKFKMENMATLGELFANTAGGDFIPHVITVNTGEDVAGKIVSFSQKGPRGICVLSANGAVSNFTIRQPGSAGGILTYEGRFEILSLSGSFTIAENGGVKSRTCGLSVSLASPDGRVIGGGVAGLLLAASPIQVVLGSFMPNGYKAQKRKQQREQTMAYVIPGSHDTVTSAKPVSQAKPDGETCLPPVLPMQPQSHDATEINGNGYQTGNVGSFHLTGWNGTEPSSNQRPSPDINVSVPSEDEVEGVL